MRISDWSSDVCSSDLAWIDLVYAQRRLAAIEAAIGKLTRLSSASVSSVTSGSARPAQFLDIRQAVAALEDKRSEVAADMARATAILSRWTGEIGRASCRERVCQYV